jgi:uncharacterized protein (DUF305 family)
MMTDQSQEISVMHSWLQDWYGIAHAPERRASFMSVMSAASDWWEARGMTSATASLVASDRAAIAPPAMTP